jgi:hypothetical protein
MGLSALMTSISNVTLQDEVGKTRSQKEDIVSKKNSAPQPNFEENTWESIV